MRFVWLAVGVLSLGCPVPPNTSTLDPCGPDVACTVADERCFSTAACGPPPGGCQTPETGDLLCHRQCLDDSECAAGERCELQTIYVPPQSTDVPTVTQLCVTT